MCFSGQAATITDHLSRRQRSDLYRHRYRPSMMKWENKPGEHLRVDGEGIRHFRVCGMMEHVRRKDRTRSRSSRIQPRSLRRPRNLSGWVWRLSSDGEEVMPLIGKEPQ